MRLGGNHWRYSCFSFRYSVAAACWILWMLLMLSREACKASAWIQSFAMYCSTSISSKKALSRWGMAVGAGVPAEGDAAAAGASRDAPVVAAALEVADGVPAAAAAATCGVVAMSGREAPLGCDCRLLCAPCQWFCCRASC